MISNTPDPPYYAVIFTSLRTEVDDNYLETNDHLYELAKGMPGFLGMESARSGLGVSVSYWKTPEDILAWKKNMEHGKAKEKGKREWYTEYKVRIAKVEKDYGFKKE
jgi:heme-degrading monooxygenase HmoA